MLQITAPIELNMRPQIVGAGEGFCNRISANYNMINSEVPRENMLHVTTEPPEYYFGSEGGSYVNNNTNISLQEENNIEIVNNLVNRIMVEPKFGMTYQDKTYISMALKKLGIKDEHNFMKQIYNMKQDIDQTNELINMYWNNGDSIRYMIEEYMDASEHNRLVNETSVSNYPLHLHENIYNRLQTAAIYSIVQNHHQNAYGHDVISTNEMLLSEQKKVYENILLKELKNTVRDESVPLVYKTDNYYEDYNFTEENVTDEKITEVINSASLLSFIRNAYETKDTQISDNVNIWYEVRPTIANNSENTLRRLENHIKNEGNINIVNRTVTQEENNKVLQEEINILNQLFESRTYQDLISNLDLVYNRVDDRSYDEINRIETYNQTSSQHYSDLVNTTINENAQNISSQQFDATNYNQDLEQVDLTYNISQNIQEESNIYEDRSLSNRRDIITNQINNRISQSKSVEETNLYNESNLENIEINYETKEVQAEQAEPLQIENNVKLVEENLMKINQQNLEKQIRYNQTIQMERERVSRSLTPEQRRERQKKDALLALSNPEEVIMTLKEEQQRAQENEQRITQVALQKINQDGDQIFNLINQYMQNPNMTIPGVQITQGDIGGLASEIDRVELINRQNEIVETDKSNTIERVTKEISKEIIEETSQSPVVRNIRENIRDLHLVHRTLENNSIDEVTEQLIEQNRILQQKTIQNEELVEERRVTNKQVINENVINNDQINRNIEEAVNNSLNQKMNMFSDQIYRKLENKLELEKRRRGF